MILNPRIGDKKAHIIEELKEAVKASRLRRPAIKICVAEGLEEEARKLGRDPQTGKERQKWYYFKTKREAEAAQARLVSQLNDGGTLPNTKQRVGEYLDRWLRDYADVKNLSFTTRRNYGDALRVHLIPSLGQSRL